MTLQSSRQALLVAAAALVAASASLGGIYMRPDIEDVPVARLVANLEKELAADPKNPDIHLRLARLYAVAYSANTTELPVTVLAGADRKPRQEVWFGHEPDLIPQKVDPGATRSEASKGFLAKSVDHYRTVVELNPSRPRRTDRIRLDPGTERQHVRGRRRIPSSRRAGLDEGREGEVR